MKVLFVNVGSVVGGAERSLLLLIRALGARGVEAHVALLDTGPFCGCLEAEGIASTVVPLPPSARRVGRYNATAGVSLITSGASVAFKVAALARSFGADIIHTNGMKAHAIGGLAGRLRGVPVVWHVRDFPPSGWMGRAFQFQARVVPSVVLTNSEAVRSTIACHRTNPARVRALHNPVDLERFHPGTAGTLRHELGLGKDVPLVGMIAHLTPWKGHSVFIEAAWRIAAEVENARFVVVGGNDYATDGHEGYRDTLLRQSTALGLDGRLTFVGAKDDVAEAMADLDVLIHCPSSPEPFGRVVAEAMASGCPVVTFRCGGIPEIVEHGITGLLIPPGDGVGLADTVAALLKDRDLRCRLGRASREAAERMFRIDAHGAAVLRAYEALVTS